MFDNLLFQPAGALLEDDILNNRLPGSLLFSGPPSSGKLTCALELARVLSCRNSPPGLWTCTCASCLQHKALVNANVLLAGPRDCVLEVAAAKHTFLDAASRDTVHINSARYLFIRSIRKLTMRFSPILWQDDDNLARIAQPVSAIDECLEEIDPPRKLPLFPDLEKLCNEAEKQCRKLEENFMYDSIPILQIRNASSWAHLPSGGGYKAFIIENADRMLDSVRNALLKILEEPPAGTVFVLMTSRRGAVLPTILSRVRTYTFAERMPDQQQEVIRRIFHGESGSERVPASVDGYLQSFLPVPPSEIRACADSFFTAVAKASIPDVTTVLKTCCGFKIRLLLKLFLGFLEDHNKRLLYTPAGVEASAACSEAVRICWTDVTVYNQSPAAALEQLVRSFSKINAEHSRVFITAVTGASGG